MYNFHFTSTISIYIKYSFVHEVPRLILSLCPGKFIIFTNLYYFIIFTYLASEQNRNFMDENCGYCYL
jgi:hypothetical protein